MSHSQFHSIKRLYLDMHGLIFETSVWLLAESTRLLSCGAAKRKSTRPPTRVRGRLSFPKECKFPIWTPHQFAGLSTRNQAASMQRTFAQLRFLKPRYSYRGSSKHEAARFGSLQANTSHMSTLAARYLGWIPEQKALESTTQFLAQIVWFIATNMVSIHLLTQPKTTDN